MPHVSLYSEYIRESLVISLHDSLFLQRNEKIQDELLVRLRVIDRRELGMLLEGVVPKKMEKRYILSK